MYIIYKHPFKGIICPLDYASRKITTAKTEVEDRAKAGTIVYKSMELKTYYRVHEETNTFIKGTIMILDGFINSEYPVVFVWRLRNLTEEEVIDDLSKIENKNDIEITDRLYEYLLTKIG